MSEQIDPGARIRTPVVKGATYFLAHTPHLVRFGSKPSRVIGQDPAYLDRINSALQTFEQAVAYPPNQAFIGNMDPNDLETAPKPWHANPRPGADRWGDMGEIMPEPEFYALLKICDEFDVIGLGRDFTAEIAPVMASHRLFGPSDIARLGQGVSLEDISRNVEAGALPLCLDGDLLVGYCRQPTGDGAEDDPNLSPHIMLENLSNRATGAMAVRHLIHRNPAASGIEYILGCGEEAVGDRYNRGGGNMAKAIGEMAGCARATGADVKAFCCAPVHALAISSGLVASGVFNLVSVAAGGSLAKLGMKHQGHLKSKMPILEDVMAGLAFLIGPDDGVSPVIRLDSIGRHEIASGSSQQAILEKLVLEPLTRLGMKLTDVDQYATEMHNPELTEPQGSGNVPRTNYRTIGSFAVMRQEIPRTELDNFVAKRGMPGFSPTQGHIASAVPVLGHAVRKILSGQLNNTMFLAKGSLFLGRITRQSDGMSFLLEKNKGGK